MASVYKPTYPKPIPANAEIITRQSERFARFKNAKGKTITAPLSEDGTKILLEQKKWYVEYKDANGKPKRVPGYTDKAATEQLAAKLEKEAARKEMGLCDPNAEHTRRPLLEHLDDYRRELESRDRSAKYVRLTISRLTTILKGCGFRFLADLNAARFNEWLAELRRQRDTATSIDPSKDWYTLTEAAQALNMKPATLSTAIYKNRLAAEGWGRKRRFPRATLEAIQEKMGKGHSVQTTNYYLSAMKSFCLWLVDADRVTKNPFRKLKPGNVKMDRRHDRRELTADELRNVLTAALSSTQSFRGLSGVDRYHLYATACATGFRASSLAALTPERFDLDGNSPVVTCASREAKNRKTKVQPIPPEIATMLGAYLKDKRQGERIWGGTWADNGRGAEMLRIDLAAAGVPYAVDGPDGPLYADFHALRHTYITLLHRGGVDLKTAQELAGHSSPILTARYSHRRLHDHAGAVEKLPNFLPAATTAERAADCGDAALIGITEAHTEPLSATGTDGTKARKHVGQHVGTSTATNSILPFSVTTGEDKKSGKDGKMLGLKRKTS